MNTILDLPDHFIISIFGYLNLKQRINCSRFVYNFLIYIYICIYYFLFTSWRVCSKWNKLSKDGSLWSIIDLRKYKTLLSFNDLNQVISTFGSASTKELLVHGNYVFDDLPISVGKQHLITRLDSNFFTKCLSLNCPNLSLISFEYLDLSNINMEHFNWLKKAETISLKWCQLNADWFRSGRFHSMKNLYLIRTGLLNINDIESICESMPNLITLTINQAQSSLGDDSIQVICKHLIKLQELDMVNTIISDTGILNICNSTHLCANLKRLNLTMSSMLSNNCLVLIAENLHGLNTLYLTSCFGISNVKFLQNLKTLNYLNLNNTSIDKDCIRDLLLPTLPKCEIEYGHEKMLNRKLMWTINSSRNCVCSF